MVVHGTTCMYVPFFQIQPATGTGRQAAADLETYKKTMKKRFSRTPLMTYQNQNSIGAQILYDTTSFAQDFLFLLRAACKK